MGKTERHVLLLGAVLFYLAAQVLILVGMGTPHWSERGGDNSFHDGLWLRCDEERGCLRQNLEDVTNEFRCAVAFTILAILFSVSAGCCLLFSYTLCSVLEIIAGVCGLVTNLTWVYEHVESADTAYLGYSWFLFLIGSVLFLPSAILFFLLSNYQEDHPNKQTTYWAHMCIQSGKVTIGLVISSILMYVTLVVLSLGKTYAYRRE